MTYGLTEGAIPGALRDIPGMFHALISDAPYELGFMNRAWDKSGVSFQPETWSACLEKLYPGAFGLVFGGSRTYHRIATAIEDAGAIIHPSIFGWLYASGFPKATRIDTQVDEKQGFTLKKEKRTRTDGKKTGNAQSTFNASPLDMTYGLPQSEEAQRWVDHRYGLQAMRPAMEPIILFQKPYSKGSKVDQMVSTGAGALNIGGAAHSRTARLVPGMGVMGVNSYGEHTGDWYTDASGKRVRDSKLSDTSWPSNAVVCHAPDCSESCSPDCAVRALEASGANMESFLILDWECEIQERIGRSPQAVYVPKPQPEEKDAGISAPASIVSDGRNKPIDNPYLRGETERRNTHPTVKPLKLAQWLATLLLPPKGYERRLLNPFSGSGSEMIGALLAGWEYVHGIELRPEACRESRERADWWLAHSAAQKIRDPRALREAVKDAAGFEGSFFSRSTDYDFSGDDL